MHALYVVGIYILYEVAYISLGNEYSLVKKEKHIIIPMLDVEKYNVYQSLCLFFKSIVDDIKSKKEIEELSYSEFENRIGFRNVMCKSDVAVGIQDIQTFNRKPKSPLHLFVVNNYLEDYVIIPK